MLVFLEENHMQIPDRELLLILSREDVFNLIEQEILDLADILALDKEDIIGILSEEMVQAIEEEKITFTDAVTLYQGYYKDNDHEDLSEIIEQIQNIQSEGYNDITEIVEWYNNDPMRIRCLLGDPLDIALDLAPDIDDPVMEFLESDDIEWVKEQLGESELSIFRLNLGEFEDDDNYSQYEDDTNSLVDEFDSIKLLGEGNDE